MAEKNWVAWQAEQIVILQKQLAACEEESARDKRAAVHGCYCEEDSPAPDEGPGHFVACTRGRLETERDQLKGELAAVDKELQDVQADYGEVEAERDQERARADALLISIDTHRDMTEGATNEDEDLYAAARDDKHRERMREYNDRLGHSENEVATLKRKLARERGTTVEDRDG